MAFTFRRLGISSICLALACLSTAEAQLVLNDPLTGSTTGTRSGGTFVAGGWKVTSTNDYIIWHVPTISEGAVEFDVTGINPNECRPGMQDKTEFFHMYDYTFGNADTVYFGGYRDNPYKHAIKKTSCDDVDPRTDSMEVLWQILPNHTEPDSQILAWNPASTYTFRIEWGPNGNGTSTCNIFRNLVLLRSMTVPGLWNPTGHSVRIAASPRAPLFEEFGAPVDAVFSNVKVWNLASAAPAAPTITTPSQGATINTPYAFIEWNGDVHSEYQVRICTQNDPNQGIAWDSNQTESSKNFSFTGPLSNSASYYAFVRLGNANGFGPWSSPGRLFTINTAYVPPGPDIVELAGDSIRDHSGPFNGLGASYFQAMRRCKFDRNRYNSDLALLASKEFNYVRILSMVGWYDAWQGIEIAPVSFNNENGTFVPAWTDYWQQFRDCIDIAYDTHGIRSQVTIFADAQLMPNKNNRINHMQTVLDNLVGREHKVIMLEVCNEAWQNGFPGSQGVADLREFAAYLNDRTDILVSITSAQGEPGIPRNESISNLYNGSAADIATEHFPRDLDPVEGGWLPVRVPWDVENAVGVPPVSSNEPIGPGASVSVENDPIKLVMAAVFAWGANLPMYVYHTDAGVFGFTTFQSKPGVGDYVHLDNILPADFAGWVRNDGKEASAPLTSFANGQANKWWTEVASPSTGVIRNTGKIKGNEFVTLPIGVRSGGVTFQARRAMSFDVFNPLTGAIVLSMNAVPGQQFSLTQGPHAYIIRGLFTDVPGSGSEVSIDLGSPDVAFGMTHPQPGDGDTFPIQVGGRSAKQNVNPAQDFYFYFGVDDFFIFSGDEPDLFITIDYYDVGTAALTLQYDAASAIYKDGGSVSRTNTNTWKQHTFHVTDAFFGNRQNNGADFRILGSSSTITLDVITVATEQPLPPIIEEVAPDPEIAHVGVAYTKQLMLVQGSPPPTWSVIQAPPGTQVSIIGHVSGWTPAGADVGDHVFEIEASNDHGTDTETWTVRVKSPKDIDGDGDVDVTDYGYVQECYSGNGFPYTPACAPYDYDSDGDVDHLDGDLFEACMSGAGVTPDC